MTDIVLFHHIQGLTPGMQAFADALRAGGHHVHTPDLFGGRTFASITEGQAFLAEHGFDAARARGVAAGEALGVRAVYAGMSFGVMPAQQLAQSNAGARGLVALHAFADPAFFGPWPDGLRAQIHGADADPYFAGEGDVALARALAEARAGVEVFEYAGDAHLFTDSSLPGYDPEATGLVLDRMLEFLEALTRE